MNDGLPEQTRYSRQDWLAISATGLPVLAFLCLRFLDVPAAPPVWLRATVLGLAIVAAAFFLSWSVEGLETGVPQSIAVAILALIEVAPEYSFEAILAWRGRLDLAAASMTGANGYSSASAGRCSRSSRT